ncbi:MAG: alpha/beta hydrolase [Ferruginibacter sp.]
MENQNEATVGDVVTDGKIVNDVAAIIGETVKTEEFVEVAPGVKLYVRDYGQGKPVILIHGWPLCSDMWEYQINHLVEAGYRVIAYDRRGFGKSSQPWDGYDYDTLTDDLQQIIEQLKLKHITLVGFSMGGGEVVRYFSRYGGAKVTKAILISSVAPFMMQTESNPNGVPKVIFDEITDALRTDRIGFLEDFGKNFFGVTVLNHPVSSPVLNYYGMLGSLASPRATLECAKSFSSTDFRPELTYINVPTLIIHGDADKTVPIKSSSDITATMITANEYIVYEGAPHGLFYTQKEKLNTDLVKFIQS